MNESSPLRVVGQLLEDAVLGYTPPPKVEAVLSFEIAMPKGRPVRGIQRLGTDENAHVAADAKKQMLKRGRWVAVYAEGAQEQSDHGVAALRLFGVSGIHPLPNPAPQTEATSTQEA